MNISKINLLFLSIFYLFISCSPDSGGDDTDVQETFGNWSPDFTSQTSNFTQTRSGSQGNQQTRTIEVTSSSSTSSSTEESIQQDINNDGDLFEDIQVIVTTYSASENLGSHQITTYEIIEDNDLGFTVGNNFYPLNDGVLKNYGALETNDPCTEEESILNCNGSGIYNIDLILLSEGYSYSTNSEFNYLEISGEGPKFYFELWMDSSDNLSIGRYYDIKTRTNEFFGTNFSFNDFYSENENYETQFEIWSEENSECGGLLDLTDCQVFEFYNYMSTDSRYLIEGEGGNTTFSGTSNYIEWTNGSLEISVDSNKLYTIKLKGGLNGLELPVKLFYKGYLGYYDVSANSLSSKSNSKKKIRM